jgi:hypothetical protein
MALMMETVSSSETWANIYQTTRRNIPEDSHLHTRRRENLKSEPISWLAEQPSVSLGLLNGVKEEDD